MAIVIVPLVLALAGLPADEVPEPRAIEGVPLQVGLFAPYAVQPGARVSVPVEFAPRSFVKKRGRRRVWRTDSLFAGPQLSAFARAGNHWSLMAQAQLGYKLFNHRTGLYSAFSLSAGYLMAAEVVAESVDLATGRSEKIREARHHFVPELSYTLGQEFPSRWGWFLRGGFGFKISPQVAPSLMFALEFGFQVRVGGGRQT